MENSDSVMIALLPINSDWCRIELPHMTLVYAGKIEDLGPNAFNELAKDASMIAALSRPITLRNVGTEVFGGWPGDDGEVNVFRLEPSTELLAMRRTVERWNASEHPFNPHVTIGPVGSVVDTPTHIAFDRVLVGWGNEYLTFSMRR